MILVKFTTLEGEDVAVNPAFVVSVSSHEGNSWISFTQGPSVCVKGSVDQVTAQINHGTESTFEQIMNRARSERGERN